MLFHIPLVHRLLPMAVEIGDDQALHAGHPRGRRCPILPAHLPIDQIDQDFQLNSKRMIRVHFLTPFLLAC